jgi:hypothetical protein
MNPVVIDLLVVQPNGADDAVGAIVSSVRVAESRIRGERAIFGEPRRERPGGYGDAETLPSIFGGSLARFASVEGRATRLVLFSITSVDNLRG